MTLVATWYSLEKGSQPSIWSIADTKISKGATALTLEGAKVFELPVLCRNLSSNWGAVEYRTSLGFSYAGSSLVGLNTYALLSSVLSNLAAGGGHRDRPDHKSIIDTGLKILKLYTSSIRDLAEVSIWGFCPKFGVPFIGTIRGRLRETVIEYDVDVINLFGNTLSFVLMGCHTDVIKSDIEALSISIVDKTGIKYWRAPITVLNDVIKDNLYSEIGGNIQMALIGQSDGFRYQGIINDIQNVHDAHYRNVNLTDLIGTSVGDCFVAIPLLIIGDMFPAQS